MPKSIKASFRSACVLAIIQGVTMFTFMNGSFSIVPQTDAYSFVVADGCGVVATIFEGENGAFTVKA